MLHSVMWGHVVCLILVVSLGRRMLPAEKCQVTDITLYAGIMGDKYDSSLFRAVDERCWDGIASIISDYALVDVMWPFHN